MKPIFQITRACAWLTYIGCFVLLFVLISSPTAPDFQHSVPIFDHGAQRYMTSLQAALLVQLPTAGVLLTLVSIILKRYLR
jgi:hypothetical protein